MTDMAYKNFRNRTSAWVGIDIYPRIGLEPFGGLTKEQWAAASSTAMSALTSSAGVDGGGTIPYGNRNPDNMYIDAVAVYTKPDKSDGVSFVSEGERGAYWDNLLNSHNTISITIDDDGKPTIDMMDEPGPAIWDDETDGPTPS